MMATILEKLESSETPKLASEEVFAFYSLTALEKLGEKKMAQLVRFPILANTQRDSVLLSPEQSGLAKRAWNLLPIFKSILQFRKLPPTKRV